MVDVRQCQTVLSLDFEFSSVTSLSFFFACKVFFFKEIKDRAFRFLALIEGL